MTGSPPGRDAGSGPLSPPGRPPEITATPHAWQAILPSTVPARDPLSSALNYARSGWRVFPARPGGKEPLTRHGFLDATTAAPLIRAWWYRWPGANVAIATGSPGPDVLDVDVRGDGDGFGALGELEAAGLLAGAFAVITTPGQGVHVYFTGTAQHCRSLPRRHLDFKAQGGYVIAPPSSTASGSWTLAGRRRDGGRGPLDWVACAAILSPPLPVRPDMRPRPPRPARLSWLAGFVARQQEGNRNNALYWASMRAIEAGLDPAALADAAVAAGLGQGEAERTVTSARRRQR